ncbi:hypothetical protein D3C86_1926160 [compost metagenome]
MKKREHAFTKTSITIGIVDAVRQGKGRYIDFHYITKKGEKIDIQDGDIHPDCIEYRKPGDTIIIEYSLIDNDYADIVECYWNDHLKRKYGFN